jgi:archaellum biogenesis protein FlaJ (TadC family)
MVIMKGRLRLPSSQSVNNLVSSCIPIFISFISIYPFILFIAGMIVLMIDDGVNETGYRTQIVDANPGVKLSSLSTVRMAIVICLIALSFEPRSECNFKVGRHRDQSNELWNPSSDW